MTAGEWRPAPRSWHCAKRTRWKLKNNSKPKLLQQPGPNATVRWEPREPSFLTPWCGQGVARVLPDAATFGSLTAGRGRSLTLSFRVAERMTTLTQSTCGRWLAPSSRRPPHFLPHPMMAAVGFPCTSLGCWCTNTDTRDPTAGYDSRLRVPPTNQRHCLEHVGLPLVPSP